jgi:hypothetical protein
MVPQALAACAVVHVLQIVIAQLCTYSACNCFPSAYKNHEWISNCSVGSHAAASCPSMPPAVLLNVQAGQFTSTSEATGWQDTVKGNPQLNSAFVSVLASSWLSDRLGH